MGRLLITLAVLVSLVWAGAVAFEAWAGWPHLSLDLSHGDAGTRAAYDRAVLMHVFTHATAGLAPLIVVAALSLVFRRSKTF